MDRNREPLPVVLIVDDEPLFLESLVEGMSAMEDKFEVATAGNGKEAVWLIENERVDLVVTDLKMPVMDGFQLLAYLSRNRRDLPIIIMTAYGTPELELNARREGAISFLDKPIDLQALTDMIEERLSQKAKGQISGISVAGFVQLMSIEAKTCTLQISVPGNTGTLFLSSGEVVSARLGDAHGDEAALEILSWENAAISILPGDGQRNRSVVFRLDQLLLESARQRDEMLRDLYGGSQGPAGDDTAAGRGGSGQGKRERTLSRAVIEDSLSRALWIEGALAAALADYQSGMCLGTAGGSDRLDVEALAAGSASTLKAQMQNLTDAGLESDIEDVLISLGSQQHLIRVLRRRTGLFLYLVLDRYRASLAAARQKLVEVESRLGS